MPISLDTIFGQTGQVVWWQECSRAVLVFAFGLILVRFAGRRVFGKWSALDIIVSIIIGSNLSRAITGSADLFGTLGATALLIALHWLLAQAAARSAAASWLLEGDAITLVAGGKLVRGLARDAISAHDLDEALRQSGVESISAAERITLEPSGKITVLKGRPS